MQDRFGLLFFLIIEFGGVQGVEGVPGVAGVDVPVLFDNNGSSKMSANSSPLFTSN